jgi:hypothetical protein
MRKRGKVVLQPGELLKPIASNQIWSGGKGLTELDKTGSKTGESVKDATRQTALNVGIGARTTQQQNNH